MKRIVRQTIDAPTECPYRKAYPFYPNDDWDKWDGLYRFYCELKSGLECKNQWEWIKECPLEEDIKF